MSVQPEDLSPAFREMIERSSLGTPEAQAARATVEDELARRVVELSEQIPRLTDEERRAALLRLRETSTDSEVPRG